MATKTISCGATPRIRIVTNDHLSLNGWDRPEIRIDIASERDLIVNQTDDDFSIEAEDDCMINVPLEAALTITNVSGSASITNLKGNLAVENVGGHLTVRQVNGLACENVGGHLRFSSVLGDLSAGNVGGNLKGEDVQGKLSARNVGGSVKVDNVKSMSNVRAGGNVRARLASIGGDVRVAAGGAIRLWLPQGAGYELEAASGGEKIVLVARGERSRYSTGHQRMTVAGGGPLVQLTAGGSVTVADAGVGEDVFGEDFGFDTVEVDSGNFDDFSERINARIRNKMDNADRRFREAERRANRQARVAGERAEEAMRRAMERVTVNFDAPSSGRYAYAPPAGQPQAAAPASKASDEERLMILNMLKEGKISAEEAGRLLDVLDGKFHTA